MSMRIGNRIIICEEPYRKCELCDKIAETRPYGPGGKRICWKCGQLNLEATNAMMKQVLFGDEPETNN